MVQLNLKIVTPEGSVTEALVDMVTLPSTQGEIGILPHHEALMAKIIPGELRIQNGSKTEILAIGEGFAQVASNTLTVMADLAVEVSSIDERAVEEAKKRAEIALSQKLSDEEYVETLAVLEKSLAQLKVKRRHRAR